MKCKYCNSNMDIVTGLYDSEFKIYECKCNASLIISLNTNDTLWNDGKPPRVECVKDNLNYKKGDVYKIVDADKYQVMVEIDNHTEWIDKNNNNFKFFI